MTAHKISRARTRDKVRAHRHRLRRQGLRPVQLWVPDTRSPEFARDARRQCLLMAEADTPGAHRDSVDAGAPPHGVRRGEIRLVSSAAKDREPLAAVVLQDDRFEAAPSVTLCPLTSNPADVPLLRMAIDPSDENGLPSQCRLMVDKIITVPRSRIGRRVGQLCREDLVRLNRAVLVFLGFAGDSGAE